MGTKKAGNECFKDTGLRGFLNLRATKWELVCIVMFTSLREEPCSRLQISEYDQDRPALPR